MSKVLFKIRAGCGSSSLLWNWLPANGIYETSFLPTAYLASHDVSCMLLIKRPLNRAALYWNGIRWLRHRSQGGIDAVSPSSIISHAVEGGSRRHGTI